MTIKSTSSHASDKQVQNTSLGLVTPQQFASLDVHEKEEWNVLAATFDGVFQNWFCARSAAQVPQSQNSTAGVSKSPTTWTWFMSVMDLMTTCGYGIKYRLTSSCQLYCETKTRRDRGDTGTRQAMGPRCARIIHPAALCLECCN